MNSAVSYSTVKGEPPAALRETSQWILWRFSSRHGKKTKQPVDRNGRGASLADTTNFMSWTEANSVAKRRDFGVGFVFTESDDFVGVDVDGVSPESERGDKIIKRLKSYAERSVSGKGFHVILRAKSQPTYVDRRRNLEVYSAGRFFVFTGDAVNDRDVEDNEPFAKKLADRRETRATKSDFQWDGRVRSFDEFAVVPEQLRRRLTDCDRRRGDDLSEIGYHTALELRRLGLTANDIIGLYMNPAYGIHALPASRSSGPQWLHKYILTGADADAIETRAILLSRFDASPSSRFNALLAAIKRASLFPADSFAIAAALPSLAAAAGNFWKFGGVRLNLYLCLYAETGAGKQAVLTTAQKIMTYCNAWAGVFGDFGSDVALETAVHAHNDVLILSDEFHHFIGRLETQSWARAYKAALLKMYSSSDSAYIGAASLTRTRGERLQIDRPFVNALMTAVTTGFLGVCGDRDVYDGFLNRFIVLSAGRPCPRRSVDELNLDAHEWLANFRREITAEGRSRAKPSVIASAKNVDDIFYRALVERSAIASDYAPLFMRAVENAKKVAGIIALVDNFRRPIVTADVAEWSLRFVDDAATRFVDDLRQAAHALGTSRESKEIAAVRSALRRLRGDFRLVTNKGSDKRELALTKKGRVSYYRLARLVRLRRPTLMATLDALADAGEIVVEKTKRSTVIASGEGVDE